MLVTRCVVFHVGGVVILLAEHASSPVGVAARIQRVRAGVQQFVVRRVLANDKVARRIVRTVVVNVVDVGA